MERADLARGMRISSLVGMPIYTIQNGKKVGSVKDVVYDAEQKRLAAVTIEEPGIVSPDRRILLFNEVASIGRDAVMVDSEDVFVREREAPEVSAILSRKSTMIGKHVMTESGNDQGSISDIFIDQKTGEAISYQVTGGLARDIGKGRGYVSTANLRTVGYDAVITPDETETLLQEQEAGGLTAAYLGARERAQGMGETAGEYVQEREIDLSRGKTAGKDVADDSGQLIISKGDTVTDDVIERAVQAGKMHNVAMATGAAGVTAGYESARARAYAATGEQLKGKKVPEDVYDDQGQLVVARGTTVDDSTLQAAMSAGIMTKLAQTILGEGARGRAESVWDETRERVAEAWNSITEKSREAGDRASRRRVVSAQKQFLTGKVSAVDIRDDDGNIILREGEVITPLALDNLDRAGKIDRVVLMPEGHAAEAPEDEEEYGEVHVVAETPEKHREH